MNHNKQNMTTETQLNQPSDKTKKRKAGEELHMSEDESDSSFPRFLVIASKDSTPIKYSIFAIQKFIQCGVGEVKEAKKLRNGTVLLEVKTKQQAMKALGMTVWFDTEITVTPHRSLNTSRGVIRCRDLRDCDDAEVLSGLASQGVTALKHIMRRSGSNTEPSNTFILTFSAPTPPKFVRAAYLRIPVELFVPNPLRCYKCQRFGHGQSTCGRPAICARCGGTDHHDNDCQAAPHCVNCSGNHPTFSKDCSEWVQQREISRVKAERQVSFGEARQIVFQQLAAAPHSSAKTYAQASTGQSVPTPGQLKKKQSQSIEIQTDLTWPINSDMPIMHLSSISTATNTPAQLGQACGGLAPPTPTTSAHSVAGAAGGGSPPQASAMGAVGGGPPSPVVAQSFKSTAASTKKASQAPPGDRSRLGSASSKGSEKPLIKPITSSRAPKGSGDLVKLSNKYSSLDEMAMDLGGASSTSPNKSRRK